MLRNDLVADLFTQYLNEAGKEFNKVFEVYDSATDYKIVKPGSIVGILSETSGVVKPIMNYVSTTCNYELKLLYSVEAGFGEIKKLNQIADSVIKALNGVPLQLSGGQAIITFSQHHTGDYNDRPRIGWSVTPKLAFKVEYSQQQDGLRYEMALIDTPFDMTTQDTRYFNSQSEQQTYYLNKVAESGVPFCEMMAPNVNSLTLQQQVYINDLRYYPEGTEKVKELNEILQKNYAIIRAMDGDTAVAYYYYWVQNATVGDNNQALLDLKMDTIQTWHFNPNLEYADCMIHKAHLNRWIDNGDGTVSFDGTVNSKLFEREDIQNVAKRLVKRTKVDICNTTNTILDNWINENVYAWLYLYVNPLITYNVNKISNGEASKEILPTIKYANFYNANLGTLTSIPSNISCLVFPIFTEGNTEGRKVIDIRHSTTLDTSSWDLLSFDEFLHNNDNYAEVYSIKISPIPPMYTPALNVQVNDNDSLVISLNDSSGEATYIDTNHLRFYGNGVVAILDNQVEEYIGTSIGDINRNSYLKTQLYTVNVDLNFNKSEIIGVNKNPKFNPKLLSSDYFNLRISDSGGEGFDYDLQKLNMDEFNLLINESLTPDINKRYVRIDLRNSEDIYIPETIQNYTGLVTYNDNSITMPTTDYQTMLANNKNFFLQNSINRSFDLVRGGMQTASQSIQSNTFGGFLGNMLTGSLNAGLNYTQNKINESLTIDNLKNSPGSIRAAQGNVVFEAQSGVYGIFVEEYDILHNEKKMINDYMDLYGYTYNQVDNIKNLDNIRHYHNYIQAELTNISGISISNFIRDDIKNRFSNGIRFWNNDTIQYNLENYENWLLESSN